MIIIDSQLENDGRVNLAAASLRAQVKTFLAWNDFFLRKDKLSSVSFFASN